MIQTTTIDSLLATPEDIGPELERLLEGEGGDGVGDWLYELIRASGHLSTSENMRWRLLCMIWLAFEYDIDKAWPYLMWLNQGEAVMSDHLSEILTEALDDFKCHLRLARWLAETPEERLRLFFSQFRNLPLPYKMGEVFADLLAQADAAELEPWLANFCRQTADQVSPYIRPWHLFAAVWYATRFNPAAGLTYLRKFAPAGQSLSAAANQTLTELAEQLNCAPAVIQWIAACPSREVKILLQDFGHPDLAAFTAAIFAKDPDYSHLTNYAPQAAAAAERFKQSLDLLRQAGLTPSSEILDLACGPLAAQTALWHALGYQVVGVDLDIPPLGLPLSGLKQRLKRGKYIKAWRAATAPYYEKLAASSGLRLNWKKLRLTLADLTRLDFPADRFDAVICCDHLPHAPDVAGLLAEAARVLKPGGLFLADIKFDPPAPPGRASGGALNRWSAAQYRAALERHFVIESWLSGPDETAPAHPTPERQAARQDYSEAELTRQEVVLLARLK